MSSIVEELRTNRESGAKRLESEYKAGLMTLARRLYADEGDAEELVNRTLAEVVAGIDTYLEQSAFFGWMCKILENQYAKDVRRKSNRMTVDEPGALDSAADAEAADRIFREVDAAILRDAIASLPEEMKDALMLRYFVDMPVGRVAKILSVPEGTVKWRLHCARMVLAAKLGAVAKTSGGKALLLALALACTAALGAAVWSFGGWKDASPLGADAGGLESASPLGADAGGRESASPLGQTAGGRESASSFDSSGLAEGIDVSTFDLPTQQASSMNKNTFLAATAAFATVTLATVPSPASAAWFDSPRVVATVTPNLEATDPHFMNMSEDGRFLFVDWHASNAAFPAELYSVPALEAASGATNRLAMASAHAADFFGAGTGSGGWKGGAISAKLGVAIPGSGKESGALYTAFSVPSFGWKADETAFVLSGFGDAGFDGLDFNAAGTRLYANQYASGHRNEIVAYDTAALKASHALSLLSTKTVEGVSRIRNLSCYTVKGRDLVYFGEGAVSGSNNSVYVYDPADDTVTALVTDATLFDAAIMNVKLSHVATGCPTMYVQTDNGRLHVFLLAPDGKSVTSAKPAKSFTPAECAALCGLAGLPANASYVKFRNFEVTDDGDTAFFAFLGGGNSGVTSPGLCVVKSGSTEDAYVSSPNKNNVLFTDYFFGANSRIEVDYAYLDANCYGFVFSPWEAGSGSRSGIWRNNGTYTYFVGNRNAGIASVNLKDTARHTMCIDAPGMKGFIATGAVTNEVDFANYNVTFSTGNWPIMFLGAANGSKTAVNATHYAQAKIYSAKIYESGVLVRDYVPAIVNGVPCLYDRVGGSIAADTRDDVALPGFGGNVPRLAGDVYLQLDSANSDTSNKGINTGYKMTATSRIEADFQISNPPGDCRPFGAWNGATGSNRPLIYIHGKIIKFFLNSGGSAVITGVTFDDERQSFALDATDMYFYLLKDGLVNWRYKSTGSTIAAEQTRPLALFADANSANGTSFWSPALGMKCWSFKISEGGTVVTNFLPHLSLDGACMKDALTGEVITPKVPRYFTYRIDAHPSIGEGYIVKTTDNRDVGLDTGYCVNARSRLECDFKLGVKENSQRLIGLWNNSSYKLRSLVWTAGGNFQYFLNSSSSCGNLAATDIIRHRHVFDIADNKVRLYTGNAFVKEATGTAAAATDYASIPVSLFADNNAFGTFAEGCKAGAQFWNLKGYDGEILVHDYVPARQNGVAGLGDKATGRFMPLNENFAAGGDLWECTSVAYIESSGGMAIDTGYHAKKTSRIEVDMMPLTSSSVCYYGSYGGNSGNAWTFWNGNPYIRFNMKGTARDSAYRFCPKNVRFTGVTDFATMTQYVVLDGRKIDDYVGDFSDIPAAANWVSKNPMGVCGAINDTGLCATPTSATMRCYAVRIYENDALVHLFVPYSGADGVGLVDLVTGDKAFKHPASTGADPTYVAGPLAVTASEVAAATATGPADVSLGKDGVQTVEAFSAGASAYRWTRNGEFVGETEDGTLGIGWRRGAGSDAFTVTPVYRTADGEVLGTPAAFTATHLPPAFVIIMR